MSMEGRKVAKVAALIAGGAVLGAGLGLLFAPQTGVETRRQIRHYAKRARLETMRLGRSVKAGVGRAIEHGKALATKQDGKRVAEAA